MVDDIGLDLSHIGSELGWPRVQSSEEHHIPEGRNNYGQLEKWQVVSSAGIHHHMVT